MDLTTTPTVLDAVKLDDYTRLRDAGRALAAAAAGVVLWDGGDLDAMETSLTEITLRKAFGDPGIEIDGTYLPLLATIGGSVFLEVVARRAPGAGAVTCTVDLFNVTTGLAVASSAVAVSLTTDNETKQKSGAITLATGVNNYRARIKSSTGAEVAARVRVVAKGA